MINEKYTSQVPNGVSLESAICPVCKKEDSLQHLFDAKDSINDLGGLFGIDLCSRCGIYVTNPRPTKESIGYYYPASYGPYESTIVGEDGGGQNVKNLIRNLLQTFEYSIPIVKPGKLLDIGCASGSFIYAKHQQGWSVEGLEYSESAVKKAQQAGLNVHLGGIDDHDFPAETFDMITGWMVLEHLYDPVEAVGRIFRWLKPGGRVAFSVPNAESFDFKKFKGSSYGIHIPNHLHHFTPTTIKNILVNGGFINIKIKHQRTLGSVIPGLGNYLASRNSNSRLANTLKAFTTAPKWLKAALFPIACMFAFAGATGRITVWAEKAE